MTEAEFTYDRGGAEDRLLDNDVNWHLFFRKSVELPLDAMKRTMNRESMMLKCR